MSGVHCNSVYSDTFPGYVFSGVSVIDIMAYCRKKL
jgi:hypothetical protein